MCIPYIARQRLGKSVTAATNTHNNRFIGRVVFYVVRVVTKESRRLVLCGTSCFLDMRHTVVRFDTRVLHAV
jgi:hypothetical protein